MVEEIRKKWCQDLEEILECPVCLIRPEPNVLIFQCREGHSICETCKLTVDLCPICRNTWSMTRNRLAEAFALKFEDIWISLRDPSAELNKFFIPDKVSVDCQTDRPATLLKAYGNFPCCIGNCDHWPSYFGPLIHHIKKVHGASFIELPKSEKTITYTWTINITGPNLIRDLAIQIIETGVFFVKLSTDAFGNFTGLVLMVQNTSTSKLFSYQLELRCCPKHDGPVFTSEVMSCRYLREAMLQDKCLRVTRSNVQQMLEHTEKLTCALLLTRNSNTAEKSANAQEKSPEKNWNDNKAEPREDT